MTPSSAAVRAVDVARTACTTIAPHLRAAARHAGPVVLRALAGQRALWKWAGIASLACRAPVPLGLLAALHALGTLLLYVPVHFRALWLPVLPLLLACLAVTAVTVGYPFGPRAAAPVDDRWWTEHRLVRALLEAGVLPMPRKDEPMPMLRRLGTPQHDSRGTVVTVALPAGRTAGDCLAARDRLSGSLGIPADRLRVAHVEGKPANVVRLVELAPRAPGSLPSTVGTARRTCWAEPVRIGETEDGSAVTLATFEQNVLLAGIPGSGKTSTARVLLGHYLLAGPDVQVFGLDGKGSRSDFAAAVPLCARWVWGTDDDALEQLEEMLRQVLGIVRDRNASEHTDRWPGVLLLLEEYQDVRAAADKAGRERLDTLLGRIVRMGRAVSVTVLVSTQRPSVDDLPSGVRNLVSQRLALQLRNGADAALVLGTAPELDLPRRRGEGILATPAGQTQVHLDHLDGTAWTALCGRATALRADGTDETAAPVTTPLTPCQTAAADLLAVTPDGLSAEVLRSLLPDDVRPASAARLGRELNARPDRFEQVRTRDGRRWAAVTPAVTTARGAVTGPSAAVTDARPERARQQPHRRMPLPSDPMRWTWLPSRANLEETA